MPLRFIATDCGSTTTKAIMVEKREEGWRLVARGEAPTTVEKPFEDVTVGVRNAIRELEEITGIKLLDEKGNIIKMENPTEDRGTNVYVSTSSAGGGLQMLVVGVVKSMTAESAARAALGAGAIVMEVISVDDGRKPYEKVELIRKLRPDMILLAGGVEGGTVKHVVELAELIAAADPKPRFGSTYKMPVIYAGNSQAREEIKKILGEKTALYIVDNIRPTLETENLHPAREKIHDLFLEHVMQQAPGYSKLMEMVDAPIVPTPGAVGMLIERVARMENIEVLGVDIGGATTDVFSVFKGIFNRTVSANLGMSYSISNVMVEAGIENILRWIPFKISPTSLRNRIRNKMIRPTTIPQLLEDLMIEQAIAREALRLSLEQHKMFATELKGVQRGGDISRAIEDVEERTLVNMMTLNLIIGSGGVLSHAPRRVQSALMMIDAFQPKGITKLAVDSIFMMPHLGVISTINEEAAWQVFDRDCLIRLGTVIAPVIVEKPGKTILRAKVEYPDRRVEEVDLRFGEILKLDLPLGVKAKVYLEPIRGADVGEGRGKKFVAEVEGGVVGLIFDGRGRPLVIPEREEERVESLMRWFESLDVYPHLEEIKV
ncbi:MAG: glutamate mutase L [Candidatus Caldipriscus sp.]|nr:glutamate mutase L [Candidatus Caldipriscus sp.]